MDIKYVSAIFGEYPPGFTPIRRRPNGLVLIAEDVSHRDTAEISTVILEARLGLKPHYFFPRTLPTLIEHSGDGLFLIQTPIYGAEFKPQNPMQIPEEENPKFYVSTQRNITDFKTYPEVFEALEQTARLGVITMLSETRPNFLVLTAGPQQGRVVLQSMGEKFLLHPMVLQIYSSPEAYEIAQASIARMATKP